MLPLFSAVLDWIHFILAGKDDIHESLDEFEILLVSMATDRVIIEKTVLPLDPFRMCR